jgi:hypothetical protein
MYGINKTNEWIKINKSLTCGIAKHGINLPIINVKNKSKTSLRDCLCKHK